MTEALKPLTKIEPSNPEEMQVFKVIWFDATSIDQWTSLQEARVATCHQVTTVGFLLDENPHRIIIAASIDEDGENAASVWAIPKAWIKKIEPLFEDLSLKIHETKRHGKTSTNISER